MGTQARNPGAQYSLVFCAWRRGRQRHPSVVRDWRNLDEDMQVLIIASLLDADGVPPIAAHGLVVRAAVLNRAEDVQLQADVHQRAP